MANIRKLKAEEIECRISQCFENKCTALLYKTARVDRAILDEVYGSMNWQNDFKLIDGKMYGGIAVCYDNDGKREWVWKWDCGTESNTEAEKGQASDCFKRAGFKWGIGIELYSAPQIWLNIPTKKNDKGKWEPVNKYEKYDVDYVAYDSNGNIEKLKIKNSKGEILFNYVANVGNTIKPKPVKSAADELFPPEQEAENSDIDIYIGINGVSDLKNLEMYYKSNRDKVKDISAFNRAVNKQKDFIMKGNK